MNSKMRREETSEKRRRRIMAAAYVPDDMLIKILSKLPHKSLLRFRTVSKSWFSLIGTPDLISKNPINNSLLNPIPTTQNSHLIIERTVLSPAPKRIYYPSEDETKQIYSFLSYNTLDLDDYFSQIPLNLPPPRRCRRRDLKIVGSCNGLVCITRGDYIFLWNPATSAIKALPHFVDNGSDRPTMSPLYGDFSLNKISLYNACFGFDAKSKDFKVMRNYHAEYSNLYSNLPRARHHVESRKPKAEVYSNLPRARHHVESRKPKAEVYSNLPRARYDVAIERRIPKAEVYSLSSGCWRNLNNCDVPDCMWDDSVKDVRAYANGVCFWWKMNGIENIVAFDLTQEAFQTTPLPDASIIGDPNETRRDLAVLDESLALIISSQQNKEKGFDIWVLSEVGVKESWTRHVTIRTPFLDLERPLGFWKNGELFMENTMGQLLLFNPFTKTVRSLQVDGVRESLQLFHYTPTLFPIDNA